MTQDQENKIDFDEAVRRTFALRRQIERDMELGREMLADIIREEKKRKIRIIGSVMAAAIIAIAFWVFGPSVGNFDQESAFNTYYSRLNADLLTRDQTLDDILQQAIKAYDEGKSNLTIELLESSTNQNSNTQASEFYLSLAYLDDNQFSKAKTHIEQLIDDKEIRVPELYWYSALINLKKQDFSKVRDYLKIVKELDPNFRKKDVNRIIRRVRFR